MAEFTKKEFILILTFWIFTPTIDMVTDLNMAIRLFRGPCPDLWVSGGNLYTSHHNWPTIFLNFVYISVIPFPDNLLHNGTMSSLPVRIQKAYKMVFKNNIIFSKNVKLYSSCSGIPFLWSPNIHTSRSINIIFTVSLS